MEIIVAHTWPDMGTADVMARANDTHDALGPEGIIQWSKDKSISSSPLLRFLERYPLLNLLLQRLTT